MAIFPPKDKVTQVENGRSRMLWTELCPSQNPDVEAVTPNVMAFGEGSLKRQLELSEVIRVAP